MLRTIRDLNVRDQRVLLRVDFNVPIEEGRVTDDTRIRACIPTIQYLIERDAKVILLTHLGRPAGVPEARYRVDPVAPKLSELLGQPVPKLDGCIGHGIEDHINNTMNPGDVVLLENVRFYHGEKDNDPDFASALANLADVYVNDAFGTAHRAHASTYGVTTHLPAAAGFLLESEIAQLDRFLKNPPRPYWAMIGGAKLSDKIGVIKNLLDKVDGVLIGGGAAFSFLHVQGYPTGKSLIDEAMLEEIPGLLDRARQLNVEIVLPTDVIAAAKLNAHAVTHVLSTHSISPDLMGLDIGPASTEQFCSKIAHANSLLWAGPMGAFEIEPFSQGSFQIAHAISRAPETRTLIGGGDTISCFKLSGAKATSSIFFSTGGGAMLEYMSGIELPAIKVLEG